MAGYSYMRHTIRKVAAPNTMVNSQVKSTDFSRRPNSLERKTQNNRPRGQPHQGFYMPLVLLPDWLLRQPCDSDPVLPPSGWQHSICPLGHLGYLCAHIGIGPLTPPLLKEVNMLY